MAGVIRIKNKKNKTDCGIAMLAGQSYSKIQESLLEILGFNEGDYFYTDASHLRALASKHKVVLGKRMRKFKIWSNKSLLAIKHKKEKTKQNKNQVGIGLCLIAQKIVNILLTQTKQ